MGALVAIASVEECESKGTDSGNDLSDLHHAPCLQSVSPWTTMAYSSDCS